MTDLEDFLKKKKIKRIKKFVLHVDGFKRPLFAFTYKGSVQVYDKNTLKKVGATKKFSMQCIERAFDKKKTISKIGTKTVKQTVSLLNVKELESVPFKHTIFKRGVNIIKGKVGKMFISVTFKAKGGKMTTEGGSRKLRLLTDAGQRTRAFNEAFRGALSKINFSYTSFTVNWVHFAYTFPREIQKPLTW